MTFLHLFSALNRKLVRDLWKIRGQGITIAMVIGCGVAMLVMSVGMMRSIELTRTAYYDQYRFADLYAPLTRAPNHVLGHIRQLPGVRMAQSRISAVAILDVPGVREPVTARLHSLPLAGGAGVNDLLLRAGRLPDPSRTEEVLVNEAFAEANNLHPGDSFDAILKGKKKRLRITGLALSPEYVYAIPPGQLIPDNQRFGVLWMERDNLAAAYDLEGSFNEVVARLEYGTSVEAVIHQVDAILDPYGGTGAYGREDQISDKFLSDEIEQLKVMVRVIPPIFLGVAAFLLNVVLARLIETEREQIGLLKAFGYSNATLIFHYAKMVLILTGFGVMAGSVLGTFMGRGLTRIYTQFFEFPFLYFDMKPDVYVLAGAVAVVAALTGTLSAVMKAARLSPATAMRPPVPPAYSGRFIRGLATIRWLDESSRMIVRHILHNPLRAGITVLGIALALSLRISAESAYDSFDRMVELTFNYNERQDATVTLMDPRAEAALTAIRSLPGVRAAEPFRSVAARLKFGHRQERQAVMGVAPEAQLSRLMNTDLQNIKLPPFGVVLSSSLAETLGVRTGDVLTLEVLEGRQPTLEVRVTGLADTYIGTAAYMRLDQLNRLMGEGTTISGAYLHMDGKDQDRLYQALKTMPVVAGVSLQPVVHQTLRETMQVNLRFLTILNAIFTSLIVIGVVYNNARISLSEKGRDLASLRVLGFSPGEVSYILLGELTVLVLAALPLGVIIGRGLSWYMVNSFSNNMFMVPYTMEPSTVVKGLMTVVVAAVISALVVRHRINTLNLVEVLKTRE